MIEVVGNVLVILSALLAVTFIGVYHFSALWWRTPDGRHVMNFMGVIAAVLVLAVVRIFIGRPPWFEVLRLVVFAGIPYVLARRLQLLLQAQFKGRQHERANGPG